MEKFFKKNRPEKDRVCNEGQNLVFCKEIREFVNESRKCQTVYANFEGYHERILKSDGVIWMNQLDTIVFMTLSNGKDRISLKTDEFADTDKLTKLVVKKIINSSTKFKYNEIRFQVVWIYYFDYLEKEMKAMPVFKVYKRDRCSEALYIDTTLVEYDSWDNFIRFCKFPVSFICVPRRGEYTFHSKDGGDLLDLEFICKNSALRNKAYRTSRPVSQTLSQVMHDLMPYARTVVDFLDTAVIIMVRLDLNLHPWLKWIPAFVSIVGICLKIAEHIWGGEESESALQRTAADYSLLLLNDSGEKPGSGLKFLSLLSDREKGPLQEKSLVNLIKLIKNPRENVIEILKCVPEFFGVSELFYFIYAGVREAERNDPDIYNWLRLFQCLSRLSSTVTGRNKLKEIGSEESEKCLRDLEKYSCEKVSSELLAPPGASGVEVYKPPLDVSGPEEFDVFGFRVYLLPKHSRADCLGFLHGLLKSDFKVQESTCSLNIKRDGQLIGLLIPFSIRSQNHAIVVVRLNLLPKVNT